MATDADLLRSAAPGDFETFVERHHDAVWRYAVRRLGPTDADEIVNDVFMTVHRRRDRYAPTRPDARPWLFGIATNMIRRHRRAETRALRALAVSGVDPVVPDEPLDRVAFSAEIATALATMRPRQRDVLFLYGVAGLTLDEIAIAIDAPVGTVKSLLHRARAHAAEHLATNTTTDGELA